MNTKFVHRITATPSCRARGQPNCLNKRPRRRSLTKWILPIFLFALQNVVQAQFICITNHGTITITGYTGPGGAVTIPSTINSLPVTGIGDYAFTFCRTLTNIDIPDTVTSIGMEAFSHCGLATVTIPESTTSIGDQAFYYCSSLTSLTIRNGITSIGRFAFSECSRLTSVSIPGTVTNIPDGAFSHCYGLTSVDIPTSITSIGASAFSYCGLTNLTLPNGVTSLGDFSFDSCVFLANVALPNSVTNIPMFAFSYCESLTSIAIPQSVTSIGDWAFSHCYGLTNVGIPPGVTNIGYSSFSRCERLTKVIIPSSVSSIGDNAFTASTSLAGVYFEGNAPSLGGSSVFMDATNATMYHLPGTTGWDTTFGGRPAALWFLPNPLILNNGPSFGVRTNGFGFIISWATNIPVVVEACADLANPAWLPVGTNTLTDGTSYFSAPRWTNYPARFYRLRSP